MWENITRLEIRINHAAGNQPERMFAGLFYGLSRRRSLSLCRPRWQDRARHSPEALSFHRTSRARQILSVGLEGWPEDFLDCIIDVLYVRRSTRVEIVDQCNHATATGCFCIDPPPLCGRSEISYVENRLIEHLLRWAYAVRR